MKYRILYRIISSIIVSMTFIPFCKYCRFLGLERRAMRSYNKGELEESEKLANELLELSLLYEDDWNYNNAIHKVHIVKGLVYLKKEDIDKANEELILAGKVNKSPQLSSFGPNMILARELLKINQEEVVLEYLSSCRLFWEMGDEYIDYWQYQIKNGEQPNFGANISY